jgi:hypothetical protein
VKVPIYEEPQAHPETRVPGSVQLERPEYGALDRGLDTVGKGIDQAAQEYDKFKHQARAADAANGFASYANGATAAFSGAPSDPSTQVVGGSTPALQATPDAIDAATAAGDRTVKLDLTNPAADRGFLGTRGKAAAAAEQPLFKSLAQRRDQIAAGFTDDETKKLFLERVQEYDRHLLDRAGAHVEQQVEVEQQDAAANIGDAAVRGSAADPGSDSGAAHLFGEAVGAVRGMFEGRPDAEAKYERGLRADIASVRLDNLLAPGPHQNIVKAREVLEANRGVLGKQLDNYDKAVVLAEQKDGAEGLASSVIEGARRPNGFIDAGKAIETWTQLPPEKRTKAASEAFDHQLELGKRQEVAVKSDAYSSALGDWLKRHDMNDVNPKTEAWMRANDQVGWDKLEDNARSYKAHKAGAGDRPEQLAAMGRFLADLRDNAEKYGSMPFAQFQRDVISGLAVKDQKEAYEKFAEAHGQAAKPSALSKEEADMLLEAGRSAQLFGPKGKDVSTWTDDQATFYRSAESQLEKKITYEKKQGHKVTTDQVSDWITGIMLKGKVKGRFFDSTKTNLEAGQDPKSKWAPEWTPDQVTRATRALQAAKVPVDNSTLDRWLRRKYGLNSAPEQSPDAGKPQPPPPHNAAELDAAGDGYGVDLSEPQTPAIPPSKKDLGLDF